MGEVTAACAPSGDSATSYAPELAGRVIAVVGPVRANGPSNRYRTPTAPAVPASRIGLSLPFPAPTATRPSVDGVAVPRGIGLMVPAPTLTR
ncbi:hypothetical protein RM52_06990 [Microbacterium hominis]|uniref:Uncharacterized protein n=1 Tax=Microbacterium hominis TaxID=162426 RepID=A0A0B4DV58_9MICO|nr:hypothetical protein RM52_06990 [Microbacterium hominis]